MRENPPQILLTNYMMLELLLTRIRERSIRDGIYENLGFLVFDELHTYRGRQGADIAPAHPPHTFALYAAGRVYWNISYDDFCRDANHATCEGC